MRYRLGLWQGVALYVGAVLGTGILVLPALAARVAGPGLVFWGFSITFMSIDWVLSLDPHWFSLPAHRNNLKHAIQNRSQVCRL
jgi:hypothetical protein